MHTDDRTAIELLYGKSKRSHTSQPSPSSSSSASSSISSDKDEKESSVEWSWSDSADAGLMTTKFRNNMPNIYDNDNDIFAYNHPLPTPIFIPRFMTSTTTTSTTTSTTTREPDYVQAASFEVGPLANAFLFHRYQETQYVDPEPNHLCLDGRFDAISLLSDGYTYVFKDAYVYKFDNNFALDKEYPRLVNSIFKVSPI